MAEFERFRYADADALKAAIGQMALDLPVADNTDALKKGITVGKRTLANTLAVHPMEGCDSEADGTPTELVWRRYERFAKGGCGVIWVEACAVCPEGRANPRQLAITEENKDEFKKMVAHMRACAPDEIYLVLQLTHSGRYSKPFVGADAIIATENEYLDRLLPEHHRIITDEELYALEDRYVAAARLAEYAGFDAVDIKACHRYLNSELLSAHTRPGDFGGSFENRTRLLFDVVRKIKAACSVDITTRINAYDEIPYPYGFGVDKEDFRTRDLSEIKLIAQKLYDEGVRLINITGGNPYYNPHINRPYDAGPYTPPTHQLQSAWKLLDAARQVKQAVPGMTVISTGFSWFRELGALLAAGCVEQGWCDIAGFGRQSFAYPDFALDITKGNGMDRKKCCIACGKCTEIMRNGGKAGCAIRDTEVYLPIYQAGWEGKQKPDTSHIAEHI
ncbi:MAG: flavin oxidoreductase/NADH oxidase [Ruminococcaceae bacterium]|nr:flavin oxidoreductase/NADH oxidase [Oscillospiraceae bacterium]